VPGGAFDKAGGFWRASPRHLFAPVFALAKIFRAAFRDEMIKAGLFDQINPAVWKQAWNINSQAIGRCEGSLKYLASLRFQGGHQRQPDRQRRRTPGGSAVQKAEKLPPVA
jgi:hypothetical protein